MLIRSTYKQINKPTGRRPQHLNTGFSPQHLNGPQAPTTSTGPQGPNTIRIMDSRTNYKNMLLALLLILAGLAGAIAPQTAAAKDYGIQIGGKEVTSDNYTDISASGGFKAVQSGTVTYDPASYRLTLNNATIEGDIYSMHDSKSYTIVLQGDNTLKNHMTPINFSSSLRITGRGLLKIEPNNIAIFVGGDLTID